MSIYATLWQIQLPKRFDFDDEWVTVFAQAVPPHIGHPSYYPKGDPYADFLPPVMSGFDVDDEANREKFRAVVIVREDRSEKDGQRYVDPMIVMTGEEYWRSTFDELISRIEDAMGWTNEIVGFGLGPDGMKKWIHRSEHRWLRNRDEEAGNMP